MTIRQSYFVPPVPYLVAKEFGIFASEGLVIDSRRTRSSGEQLEGLLSREIDVAITAIDNIFVWNTLGADVRVIAQVEKTTLLSVYATPGHRSLRDLDQGRFAVDATANGFAIVARRLLEDCGVFATFIEVGGVKERFEALVAGTVAATLLGPPLDELAERSGLIRLASANEAIPTLPGQGVVVRATRSRDETEELRAYLAALDAAIVITDSMADRDGVALLQQWGFPGRSAVDAWRTRPRSIAVDPDGLAALESLRAGFNLLPIGYEGTTQIVDGSLTGPESGYDTDRTVS